MVESTNSKQDKQLAKAAKKAENQAHKPKNFLNDKGKNRFAVGRYFCFFDGDDMGSMKNKLGEAKAQ